MYTTNILYIFWRSNDIHSHQALQRLSEPCNACKKDCIQSPQGYLILYGIFFRPFCHREGYGDPFYRLPGPGAALADTDLYNVAQQQILQANPISPNASLNAYCNSKTQPLHDSPWNLWSLQYLCAKVFMKGPSAEHLSWMPHLCPSYSLYQANFSVTIKLS